MVALLFSRRDGTYQITSAELRQSIFDFSVRTFFPAPGQTSNLDITQVYKCNSDGHCSGTGAGQNPAYAWALLMLAQAKVEYFQRDEQRYTIASQLLEGTLNRWIATADGNVERHSLHQLYDVAEITGDDQFMYWVRDRHAFLVTIAKSVINQANNIGHPPQNSFLLSTTARQLALGLKATLDHENTAQLAVNRIAPNTEVIRDTLDVIQRIMSLASEDSIGGFDASYPPIGQLNGQKYPQMACFQTWAKTATLKLRSSLNEADRKFLPYNEAEVSTFFKDLLLLFRKNNVDFIALQSLIPCIQSLGELKAIITTCTNGRVRCPQLPQDIITMSDIDSLYVRLVEYALQSWDGPDSNCQRDRGFFSRIVPKTNSNRCSEPKGIVDNSWLSFALQRQFDNLTFTVGGKDN